MKRTIIINIRADKNFKDLLVKKANNNQLSVSSYLRNLVMKDCSSEELEMIYDE